MKIYIATDHAGYEYKEELIKFLSGEHQVVDLGNKSFDPDDDYPDFVIPLAEKVAEEEGSLGIVLGKTGNGEAIAANKVKGIKAALCLNEQLARKAREHNQANVLALGTDMTNLDTAKAIVTTFLSTPFSKNERHARRVKKITTYESSRSRT